MISGVLTENEDMTEDFDVMVGIDWGSESHTVAVLDPDTGFGSPFEVAHSREGLDRLCARLGDLESEQRVIVGIERREGLLVDRLLEEGFAVVVVSPNAIKTWREGEVISGAKSDVGDSMMIAWYVFMNLRWLSVITPFSEATKQMRALTRAREDLVRQRVGVSNQLTACLEAFWPAVVGLFSSLTSNISLAFLEDYPSPRDARLGEKRMAQFLRRHSYSGRTSPTELVRRLNTAAPGRIHGPAAEGYAVAAAGYVAIIRTLNEQIDILDREIDAALGEHPDGEIFSSFPRSGRINAAQILAEWGDSRQAYDDADSVAMLAGVTPVTRKSGKHQSVGFRWACNKRFRTAITTLANNTRFESAWAADVYQKATDRGCDHPHALRVLARAWIRVIYRCWINHTPYDPQQHGNARKLAQQQLKHAA